MIIISTQAFPPASGGKQTLMESLAKSSAKLHPVTVLADTSRGYKTNVDLQNTPYDLEWFSGLKKLRQINKARRVEEIATDNQATHIFCDSWHSAEQLPDTLPCPVIIFAHGNEFPKDPSSSKVRLIMRSLAKATHIIAVSRATALRVQAYLPLNGGPKLHVRPNPVSEPDLATEDDVAFAEALWPADGVKLLALCRLVDWKGIDVAITALRQIILNGKSAQMVIAGTGPDRNRLKEIAAASELSDRITFAGRVEGGRKSALFASADIYVQPGRQIGDQCEGFGITYIEAGQHHLPSLSGDAGGAPDAVIHGQTGLVVDGENIDEVVIALQGLIDEPDRASHMGDAAYAQAQTLLWDRQIGEVLALT